MTAVLFAYEVGGVEVVVKRVAVEEALERAFLVSFEIRIHGFTHVLYERLRKRSLHGICNHQAH